MNDFVRGGCQQDEQRGIEWHGTSSSTDHLPLVASTAEGVPLGLGAVKSVFLYSSLLLTPGDP